MREAALTGRRAVAVPMAAAALAVLVAGCELGGLLGPDGLLDVSLPGSEPEAGQVVVFEGQVVAVDTESSGVRLAEGTEVSVPDSIVLRGEFGVTSLQAARDVLEGELDLIAWGSGVVASVEPLVVVASELTLKPAERVEFEGHVAAVDVAAGIVQFEDGRKVRVTRGTEVNGDAGLPSLAAAAEALEAGKDLLAWGSGWERSAEPRRLLARTITLKVVEPAEVEFEGEVTGIDAGTGTVTLASGTIIRLTAETHLGAEHGVASLAAAKELLDAGEDLIAWGAGVLESEEPRTIRASKLTFKVRVAEFEGLVSEVFATLDGFRLTDGTVVHVNAETSYSNEFDLPSLDAARAALDAGHAVAAWGQGRLEHEEPRTLAAREVLFKVVE